MIAAGRPVIVFIGGANRDPGAFEQPDEFRIDRLDPGRHLSFSLGMHHCLGSSLARLEGRIAIEELTRRYPELKLAAPPTRRPLLVLRGFESVPVRATQMPSQSAASGRRRWHPPTAVRPDSATTRSSYLTTVTFTPSDRSLFARSGQMPIRFAAHEALGPRFGQPV